MERLCRQNHGLFPKPSDIRFTCSCPDYASMCKHVAAVLYGVGARLDQQPELLFRLRAVNENDLVANIGTVLPMSKKSPAAGRTLEVDDVSALFGLDIVGVEAKVEAGGDRSAVTPPPCEPKPSGARSKGSTQQGVGLHLKTGADQTVSRQRAARNEDAAPKQGVSLRPVRATKTPARAFSSTADNTPHARRETAARAASAGTRDQPTETPREGKRRRSQGEFQPNAGYSRPEGLSHCQSGDPGFEAGDERRIQDREDSGQAGPAGVTEEAGAGGRCRDRRCRTRGVRRTAAEGSQPGPARAATGEVVAPIL